MTQTVDKPDSEDTSQSSLSRYSLVGEPIGSPSLRVIQSLRLLWYRRPILLRAVAVGVLGSALIAFLIPKSYVSTTQLMPPDAQSSSASGMAMMAAMASRVTGMGSMGGSLGSMAGDLMGMKSSGALFMGVLRSRTVQDHLVERFELKKVYRARFAAGARARLDENTSISEDRKSGIITIMVTDHDPQRATALANAYVDQLNSLVADLSTSSAHRERVFLESRLKVVKQNLDEVTSQFADFSSKNSTLDIQEEAKAMLTEAAQLEGQMVAAQSQLEGLRQIYTDNNPRVQSLQARVAQIQKGLQKLRGANGKGSEAGSGPDSSADLPYPSIQNLPLLGVKYADYYRNAKIQETVYELLTQQYELAKVQEAKETPSVKVLDPAIPPEEKSFPPRALIILIGAAIAAIAGSLWILGAERWKEVDIHDPRKIFLQQVGGYVRSHVTSLRNRNGASVKY